MLTKPHPTRVAIVDDDPTYGRAAARLLRASDFEAVTYRSAEAFLASAPTVGADCLLLDVHLGGMTGFDLQRRLAEAGDRTPVVFISGHTDEGLSGRAAESGCAFLSKADPGDAVIRAIRAAVERARLPQEAVAADPGLPHLTR